jgi:hypothetical protein
LVVEDSQNKQLKGGEGRKNKGYRLSLSPPCQAAQGQPLWPPEMKIKLTMKGHGQGSISNLSTALAK